MKTCGSCGKTKTHSEFTKNKSAKDGYRYACNLCRSIYRTVINRAVETEYRKRYHRNNKIKAPKRTCNRFKQHARIAKNLSLMCDLTEHQWQETLRSCDFKCVYCGSKWESYDHFVPLSKGGGFEINNIVPACSSCNSAKHNKSPFEFIRLKQKPLV